MEHGHTLSELIVVLLLVAVGGHAGLEVTRPTLDRWTVRGARSEAASLIEIARNRALGTSGAVFVADEEAGIVQVVSDVWPDTVVLDLSARGVAMEVVGSRSRAELRFNALGLGVVASQRLRFRRGDAAVDLIVSSLGRVRTP